MQKVYAHGCILFQSTPPSREATYHEAGLPNIEGISIHAPLTGGDTEDIKALQIARIFQSTPPSREATY